MSLQDIQVCPLLCIESTNLSVLSKHAECLKKKEGGRTKERKETGMFKKNNSMSQSSPAPRLTFFTFSLNLHFQNICILSVCLSSFLINAVFPSATAFDLLHLSLQL